MNEVFIINEKLTAIIDQKKVVKYNSNQLSKISKDHTKDAYKQD